jgi:hypothetical protein
MTMPSDNKELRSRVVKIVVNVCASSGECSVAEPCNYCLEDTDKVLALIADQCRLAVIEELKQHAPEWVEINEDGTINPSVVYDRIKTLEDSND